MYWCICSEAILRIYFRKFPWCTKFASHHFMHFSCQDLFKPASWFKSQEMMVIIFLKGYGRQPQRVDFTLTRWCWCGHQPGFVKVPPDGASVGTGYPLHQALPNFYQMVLMWVLGANKSLPNSHQMELVWAPTRVAKLPPDIACVSTNQSLPDSHQMDLLPDGARGHPQGLILLLLDLGCDLGAHQHEICARLKKNVKL